MQRSKEGNSRSQLHKFRQQRKRNVAVLSCPARLWGRGHKARGGEPKVAGWRWLWYNIMVDHLSACGGCGVQAVWGEALERVAEGLAAGRRWLWYAVAPEASVHVG